jgi:hypothetical protein
MVCGAVFSTAITWQSPRQFLSGVSACGCGLWQLRHHAHHRLSHRWRPRFRRGQPTRKGFICLKTHTYLGFKRAYLRLSCSSSLARLIRSSALASDAVTISWRRVAADNWRYEKNLSARRGGIDVLRQRPAPNADQTAHFSMWL